MKFKYVAVLSFVAVASLAVRADVLRVVHEPRQVPSVSSKVERGKTKCRWCGSRINYDRTYRWDPYDKVWIETTKEVPESCRKCKALDKGDEKRRREEDNLDRKLDQKATKMRIETKRNLLRNSNGR